MASIKVGISGLGWAASGHMLAYKANPNVEVVAACTSKSCGDARDFCGGDVAVYDNYDEFLKHPGLDAVDICTPHRVHAEQAIKAAQAGKHLLIEKPLALSYDVLLQMRDAISEAGVLSTVFFELRFIPQFDFIKGAIADGMIGDVHYLEVDYYHGIGPWYGQYSWNAKKATGGSALITAGCHALDALLFFADREVEEVFGYSARTTAPDLQEYDYDSTSVAIIKFADGTCGKCVACVDCRQPYLFNINLIGSAGTIYNDNLSTLKLNGVTKGEWIHIPTTKAESGDVLDHPYGPQIDDFIQCIGEGRDSKINFSEAFKTHRVMFAIEKALAEGRPVKLSEMPL